MECMMAYSWARRMLLSLDNTEMTSWLSVDTGIVILEGEGAVDIAASSA
jgi:hypothetical protein